MLAKVDSCSVAGIDAFVVEVEVDISYGLPAFNIVGLPEVSVRESKDRVKTAIKNSGYTFPMERVVVNLAPADIKKEGTGFDLPIAVAILVASDVLSSDQVKAYMICGELSLDGQVKPVKAVLPFALTAKQKGLKGIIVPFENADEASMVQDIDVLPVKHLAQVVDYFAGFKRIERHKNDFLENRGKALSYGGMDFCEVKGQQHAKRALEIAAAGFHNVMMTGPPGSGKSMLAKRVPTILPGLTFDEAVDVTRIYSVTGLTQHDEWPSSLRPFRSPHHTISDAGLVGGGSKPSPGEISLAHHGVLFLDELPEFKKNVLEVLRQPLEDGKVTIARAGIKATYPCQFMLLAAMNPCSCGFLNDPMGNCSCSAPQIQKYRSKISGPLMDRIDIQIEVPRLEYKDLASRTDGETSAKIRERVETARQKQHSRFRNSGFLNNSKMHSRHLRKFCRLDAPCEGLIEQAMEKLGLSARACHSVVRVARTIADLENCSDIKHSHLAEAIQYRSFDRNGTRSG